MHKMPNRNPSNRLLPLQRRHVVGAALAVPLLHGCTSSLPVILGSQATPAAQARLRQSAEAHGIAAYPALRDINVSYAGQWRALIERLQPALVDSGFRVSSQERLMPAQGLVAQTHNGPGGTKQVLRRAGRPNKGQGDVRVWFNGEEARDGERLAAAALVADGYALFLLGPLLLAGRDLPMELGGTATVDGRSCDVLNVQLVPGLGFSSMERVALLIDREDLIMRGIRFSLEGLESTQGAVAEVHTFDHLKRHGVLWPTRFYERLLKPIPRMPVHDWKLTGLDVNRGYGPDALTGSAFGGAAVAPATTLKI